jgi:hypothetical protein
VRFRAPLQSTVYWGKQNMVGFDISEIAFNWNAGGTSSTLVY